MRAETLKGHLDALLLSVVAAGAAHGYAIIEALRERSAGAFDLPEGTVYPALHRLERAGHLSSKWVNAAGRKRRVYALTTKGRRSLSSEQGEWQKFSSAMTAVLGRKPWPTGA
jgi:DNA-binding PadR family transcriptional regulator